MASGRFWVINRENLLSMFSFKLLQSLVRGFGARAYAEEGIAVEGIVEKFIGVVEG